MKTIDASGLSCPEPVIRTRTALKALPSGEVLEVLVETVTSRENVRRYALTQKCEVSDEETENGFRVIIHKP
jgi:TusA-related sulfurtransferase